MGAIHDAIDELPALDTLRAREPGLSAGYPRVGLTLIGRMRGQRFQCLAGRERLIYDANFEGEGEDQKHRRKSAQ